MIAADTSVWINFFKGSRSSETQQLESVLHDGTIVMPLPVLFELLSSPGLTTSAHDAFIEIPRLDLFPDYWERAAELRQKILRRGLKARSMDCLIAQNCIDHDVSFLSGDQDYRHFTKYGLKLI